MTRILMTYHLHHHLHHRLHHNHYVDHNAHVSLHNLEFTHQKFLLFLGMHRRQIIFFIKPSLQESSIFLSVLIVLLTLARLSNQISDHIGLIVYLTHTIRCIVHHHSVYHSQLHYYLLIQRYLDQDYLVK